MKSSKPQNPSSREAPSSNLQRGVATKIGRATRGGPRYRRASASWNLELRRSAGFQPAVSPISNRQAVDCHWHAGTYARHAGWKLCDTAGWKPALRRGMALVITLILLSVVTFMAITFMVVSRAGRNAVATKTEQIAAEQASKGALEKVKSEGVVAMMLSTNAHNYDLWVSTNYINPAGFFTGISSPTNVNYDYTANGTPFTLADRLQNPTNLMIDPRPPVFITNRFLRNMDFRYYI